MQEDTDTNSGPAARETANSNELVRSAVSGIPAKIAALGGTREQSVAMAEAMRLVLLGQNEQAWRVLEKAGFPRHALDEILKLMDEGLRSAA